MVEILEGLTKVEGSSFEEILSKLEGTRHVVHRTPTRDNIFGYLRNSLILVPYSKSDGLIELLGQPDKTFSQEGDIDVSGLLTYYAEYKIENDFDLEQLEGILKFKKGAKLVERTALNCGMDPKYWLKCYGIHK